MLLVELHEVINERGGEKIRIVCVLLSPFGETLINWTSKPLPLQG